MNDLKWNKMYELAKEYYLQNGSLDILEYFVTESGVKLGRWLYDQRLSYYGLATYSLNSERIKKLESIGMRWDITPALKKKNDKWELMYNYAKKYYFSNGDLNVPYQYEIDGFKLGLWIRDQRAGYKNIGNRSLSDERIKKLDEIEENINY